MGTTRRRILVVDDNETVLSVLREFLGQAYVVSAATSAAAALSTLATSQPDLIFLDVRMPGTDGLTLLGSLRRLGITVPIFVMTGYDSEEISSEATRSGASGYLVKPVDLREVDRIVSEAFGTPRLLG